MVNLTSIANVMTSWFSEFGSLPFHRTVDNSDDDVYDGYNDDGNQEDDCDFQNLALFLFTDLLVVAKRKSEERFVVLDYSPRNMIQVMLLRFSSRRRWCVVTSTLYHDHLQGVWARKQRRGSRLRWRGPGRVCSLAHIASGNFLSLFHYPCSLALHCCRPFSHCLISCVWWLCYVDGLSER